MNAITPIPEPTPAHAPDAPRLDPEYLALLAEQGAHLTDAEADLVARWCGVRS